MIVFKKTSEKGSKIYYDFSTIGLSGNIVIDKESLVVDFVKTEGKYKDDAREKEKLLYIATKNLKEKKYPEKYTYAFC